MTCILVLGCGAELGARLRDELERHGAEIVVADDPPAAVSALAARRIDGVVAALDAESTTGPRASGLGLLLSARAHHPIARRVLVVERRGPVVEAALATGIADRVLAGPPSAVRVGALAEWLADVASHAPRREPS